MTTAKILPNKPKQAWPKIKPAKHKNGTDAWMVDARLNGQGTRLFFKTKGEAQTVAEQLRIKRKNEGDSAFAMPAVDRTDAEVALETLKPHGASLREAVRFYIKHLDVVQRDILLADLVVEMMESKRADGISKYTFQCQRSFFRKVSRSFPGAKLSDLTAPAIDDWLRGCMVAPITRNDYRLKLWGMFTYAKKRKYCINNPVEETTEVRVDEKEPGILTVGECVRLLHACVAHGENKMVVSTALGLFAGLRPLAEVLRLGWEHINFKTRLIDIAPDRTKAFKKCSAQRRFVEMQPNLVEWLLPYRQPSGPVGYSPTYYTSKLALVRAYAGLTHWPHDALRHCFASYHYAHFNDAGRTCKELGHTNFSMLFKHYRARVDPDDAVAYWNICPGLEENNVVPMIATGNSTANA